MQGANGPAAILQYHGAVDAPKYRPLERFWPYADLPEQPTDAELAALDPDLHDALFGPKPHPFSISLVFQPLDSPEFHRNAFTRIWDRTAPYGSGDVVERDRAITRGLIDAIRARDTARPFFAFYFLDAPHAYAHPDDMASPFTPMLSSVNYLELSDTFDPLPFLNLYKTSVLFDDGLVGEVLAALEADSRLQGNTIVIVTGDHG